MKTMIALLVLSTAVYAGDSRPSPPAEGTTLKGAKAKPLIRALRLSGVKFTKAKQVWTFKATSIDCHSANESDDGLGWYDCTVDKQKLKDAAAAYLMDAMISAGFEGDDHMSQSNTRVANLVCVDDQGASGGPDAMYTCSFVPASH